MSRAKAARLCLDITLFLLLLYLLSYPVTRGLMRHGTAGMAFLVLLIVHLAANRSFYLALFCGRWTWQRWLSTLSVLLLSAAALVLTASALVLAGEIFPGIAFAQPYWGRSLHTAAAAWSLVLASFHMGLHGQRLWKLVKERTGSLWSAACCILPALSGCAFLDSPLACCLLLVDESLEEHSAPSFLLHTLGTVLFFMLLAQCLKGLGKAGSRQV